jgi:uncharacterized protein involved in outer membrane biogenesis
VRKVLLYAAVALVGIAILAVVVLLSMASSLAARYKPALEAQLSETLGVPVALGAIHVSVFPALRLRADGVQVGASPGEPGGMSVKALTLRVQFGPLLRRELVVDTVRIERPKATIVKTAAGVSIAGLASSTRPPADRPGPARDTPRVGTRSAAAPADASPSAAGATIALRRIEIRDGTFTFRDADANRTWTLTGVDSVASVSLHDRTVGVSDLRVDGKLDERHDVGIGGSNLVYDLTTGDASLGRLTLDLPGGSLVAAGKLEGSAGSGTATVQSSGLHLQDLAPFVASVVAVPETLNPTGTVRPDLRATWKMPTFGIEGTVTLDAVAAEQGAWHVTGLSGPLAVRLDPKHQVVQTDALACTINDAPMRVAFELTVDASTAHIDRLRLDTFSGTVTGDASLSLAAGHPFHTRLTGTGLSVAQALHFADPGRSNAADGTVSTVALDTRGRAGSHIVETLDGSGRVDVRDATLKGVNIGHAVLGATKVPFIEGALLALVPAPFRKQLADKDTPIHSLTGDFSIRGGWAETRNLVAVSDLFAATAAGRASTGMELALTATVAFDRGFSQAMASSVRELRLLFDEQGRLSIPVKLTGQLPNVSVEPDLAALLKMGGLRGTLEGTLERLLGGKKNSPGNVLDRLLPR